MRFDGRNPYGARGGYMRDRDYASRIYRDYADMADSRYDYARGDRADRRYNDFDYCPYDMRGRYGDYDYAEMDYDMDYAYGRDRARGRDRYPRDGHAMMSDEELKKWSKKLMEEVDEKDKQFLKMENIVKKAEQLGIRFDEFSPYEFYVTVLMVFTDYHKTIGTANYDVYIKLAKDWLCDEDAAVKYGKKLTAYHENIVND